MDEAFRDERIRSLERELLAVKSELRREIWDRKMLPLRLMVYASYGVAGLSVLTLVYVLASR
jgi:hypothetical protein